MPQTKFTPEQIDAMRRVLSAKLEGWNAETKLEELSGKDLYFEDAVAHYASCITSPEDISEAECRECLEAVLRDSEELPSYES